MIKGATDHYLPFFKEDFNSVIGGRSDARWGSLDGMSLEYNERSFFKSPPAVFLSAASVHLDSPPAFKLKLM